MMVVIGYMYEDTSLIFWLVEEEAVRQRKGRSGAVKEEEIAI